MRKRRKRQTGTKRKRKRKRTKIVDLTKSSALIVRRCEPRFKAKANTQAQALGLAYERKVVKYLRLLVARLGGSVEHNPWFMYKRDAASAWGFACPDCVVSFGTHVIVVEVKLTYVEEAAEKLTKTYLPLVRAGLCAVPGLEVSAIVIAKTLTPLVGERVARLSLACGASRIPTLHWLGHQPISW